MYCTLHYQMTMYCTVQAACQWLEKQTGSMLYYQCDDATLNQLMQILLQAFLQYYPLVSAHSHDLIALAGI
jgi:cell division FtsZ-interacting protein ZapD